MAKPDLSMPVELVRANIATQAMRALIANKPEADLRRRAKNRSEHTLDDELEVEYISVFSS